MKLAILAAVLAVNASAGLPEGSVQGKSPLIKGADVMAFVYQKDPNAQDAGWAIVAEYDRTIEKGPIWWDRRLPAPERIQLTKWIWRLYAYRVEPAGDKRYALKPLSVNGTTVGVDASQTPGLLALKKDGTLDGAVLTRYDRGSAMPNETITLGGWLSTTWEGFVPGNYFLATDTTGGEYFLKSINMTLSKDRVADYKTKEIEGRFDLLDTTVPKLFVLRAQNGAKGASKIEGRLAVFIDIVNWKPVFTTDELLLINPNDARDVGFYYERH